MHPMNKSIKIVSKRIGRHRERERERERERDREPRTGPNVTDSR